MSGHSKWAKIKRAKGANDAKRGVLFSKLSKKITISAKAGGNADPSMNFQLRSEIENAKALGLPNDNIERAIKKAFDKDASIISEVVYEGYGPFGTAFLVEVATDNTNRAVQNIKHIFAKHGGSLGAMGSVAWMFETRGQILVRVTGKSAEELELLAIDAGAVDVVASEEGLEILTNFGYLQTVRQKLEKMGVEVAQSVVVQVPTQIIHLSDEQKTKVEDLYSALEEYEDVVEVQTNADL